MPLPPLPEQQRIVARIEELAGKIAEALRIGVELEESVSSLWSAAALKYLGPLRKVHASDATSQDNAPVCDRQSSRNRWEWVRLGNVCSMITDGTHQTPSYVDDGMPFLSAQNVKPFRFLPEGHRKVSREDYEKYISRVKPEAGDVLMTRVGAMIGEAAVIDRPLDFAFYVSLCLLKLIRDKIDPSFLVCWLNSPQGVEAAKRNTLGKGHSQGNLNLNLVREFVVPLPPLHQQRRIAAELLDLRKRTEEANRERVTNQQMIAALLPSVLDKAFRGEL
jgi:type I restriction enzyme S subunit